MRSWHFRITKRDYKAFMRAKIRKESWYTHIAAEWKQNNYSSIIKFENSVNICETLPFTGDPRQKKPDCVFVGLKWPTRHNLQIKITSSSSFLAITVLRSSKMLSGWTSSFSRSTMCSSTFLSILMFVVPNSWNRSSKYAVLSLACDFSLSDVKLDKDTFKFSASAFNSVMSLDRRLFCVESPVSVDSFAAVALFSSIFSADCIFNRNRNLKMYVLLQRCPFSSNSRLLFVLIFHVSCTA